MSFIGVYETFAPRTSSERPQISSSQPVEGLQSAEKIVSGEAKRLVPQEDNIRHKLHLPQKGTFSEPCQCGVRQACPEMQCYQNNPEAGPICTCGVRNCVIAATRQHREEGNKPSRCKRKRSPPKNSSGYRLPRGRPPKDPKQLQKLKDEAIANGCVYPRPRKEKKGRGEPSEIQQSCESWRLTSSPKELLKTVRVTPPEQEYRAIEEMFAPPQMLWETEPTFSLSPEPSESQIRFIDPRIIGGTDPALTLSPSHDENWSLPRGTIRSVDEGHGAYAITATPVPDLDEYGDSIPPRSPKDFENAFHERFRDAV